MDRRTSYLLISSSMKNAEVTCLWFTKRFIISKCLLAEDIFATNRKSWALCLFSLFFLHPWLIYHIHILLFVPFNDSSDQIIELDIQAIELILAQSFCSIQSWLFLIRWRTARRTFTSWQTYFFNVFTSRKLPSHFIRFESYRDPFQNPQKTHRWNW